MLQKQKITENVEDKYPPFETQLSINFNNQFVFLTTISDFAKSS